MNGTTNNYQSSLKITDDHNDEHKIKFMDWGFNIDRLFEVAYRFYKRNESKAFHPSFDVRNQMNALILQARYGDHDSGRAPDIGVLDFVGKRRQYEWTLLKGMSKTEAMSKFICNLDELCPFFKSHAEAVKISSGYDQSLDNNNRGGGHLAGKEGNPLEPPSEANEQLKAIYSSLCRQTQNQFKSYAEKQYPNEVVQQRHLIKSLQEQYFHQYVSQMHPQLKDSLTVTTSGLQNGDASQTSSTSNISSPIPSPSVSEKSQPGAAPDVDCGDNGARAPSNTVTSIDTTSTKLVTQLKFPNVNPTPLESNDHNFDVAPRTSSGAKLSEKTAAIIEADISCEELDTSNMVTIQMQNEMQAMSGKLTNDTSQGRTTTMNLQINLAASQIGTPTPTTATPSPVGVSTSSQRSSPQSNHIEHVRLYQNTNLPPIGPFEYFPEPKPIQSTGQTPATPIDNLDPNLKYNGQISFSNDAGLPSQKSKEEAEPVDIGNSNANSYNHITRTTAATETLDQFHHLPVSSAITPTVPTTASSELQLTSSNELVRQESQDHKLQLTARSEDQNESPEPIDPIFAHSIPNETVAPDQEPPELWGCASSESDDCESQVDTTSLHEHRGPNETASTWSKKGVSEFKQSLSDDKYGGVYEVKEGTMVIIQVPTYPDGRFIYWEFATDDYDIAFGLDFVFEMNLVQPLSLKIYEDSEDEDEILDDSTSYGAETEAARNDLTSNCNVPQETSEFSNSRRRDMRSEKARRLANTITIVPTYRRDSHEEIFVGRHRYPGKGYYLLKFDNTYSVLRSKTLYFRICYFI